MIGTAQHWKRDNERADRRDIRAAWHRHGLDVGMFLWAVLASVEWLANRYAGWLFKQVFLSTPAIAPGLPA